MLEDTEGFRRFEMSKKSSIGFIKGVTSRDDELSKIVNWMLRTKSNPYSFLPYKYADSFYTYEGFTKLIIELDNAIYENGEISFVKVNGYSRIVFAKESHENFREKALSKYEILSEKARKKNEILIKKNINLEKQIEVLDILPSEFGEICDRETVELKKRCFRLDAKKFGIDFAVKHYGDDEDFDESWKDGV